MFLHLWFCSCSSFFPNIYVLHSKISPRFFNLCVYWCVRQLHMCASAPCFFYTIETQAFEVSFWDVPKFGWWEIQWTPLNLVDTSHGFLSLFLAINPSQLRPWRWCPRGQGCLPGSSKTSPSPGVPPTLGGVPRASPDVSTGDLALNRFKMGNSKQPWWNQIRGTLHP